MDIRYISLSMDDVGRAIMTDILDLTSPQELYVLNEAGKIIHLCSDCIIIADKPGCVKNTEDCEHIS